ncbi:M48 family metallopeptidase [Patescibacteria group bacterium]|nr:M48 family metallopeptidase [Patescibacteria group bacterium]
MYKEIDRNIYTTWLILIVFFLLIVILGYLYGEVTDIGLFGLLIGLFVAVPSVLIGYYSADSLVLMMAGAKEIQKKDNPMLYNTVENLAITAGMPTPKIYIIEDQAMNAFATGRGPEHAVVAVTSGLLNRLEKIELEGVIAHELSHIKNYDTRLGVMVVIFVGLIAVMADIFWRSGFRRSDSRKRSSTVLMIVGLVFIILSPVIAKLLQLALSRNREFLADADGALLSRYPDGLARALEKISGQANMLKRSNSAMNHLFIINPFESLEGQRIKSWFSNLFATHPPTEERIRRLREMGG